MNRTKEDNVVFVLQKTIEHLKIKVAKTSVKEFLLAHPHYPTLKSVCDALKKWNVEHYALTLKLHEIKALEMPFIAHLKLSGGQLVFVEKIEKEEVTYFASEGKAVTEEFKKFAEKLSGAVVVMEAGKDSGEKEYRKNRQNEILNKSLLPVGIATFLILLFANFILDPDGSTIQSNYIFWALTGTKLIGLTASIFLVLHEFKIHTPLADKICSFSSKTDCDTVLSSNASILFGWINWADTGLIYFIGTSLYLTGANGNSSLWVLAIISALALPYPVYSIYYQAVVAKKWCPFCLMVQVVLITEFIVLVPAFKSMVFSGTDIIRIITSFLIPATIWLFLKAYLEKLNEKDKEHYSFLSFKRNPDIFLYLLKNNGHQEILVKENSLIIGSSEAPITITAFLSLYCNPCATAYNKLETLLNNCGEVKINLIFSVYDDEESKKLINTLYSLYNKNNNEAITEFLRKWYGTHNPSRKALYENKLPDGFNIAEQTDAENKELFEKFKIPGTPTIYVNGYKFPTQYEYSDIEFYIGEIKSLTMESKRQEACTTCN